MNVVNALASDPLNPPSPVTPGRGVTGLPGKVGVTGVEGLIVSTSGVSGSGGSGGGGSNVTDTSVKLFCRETPPLSTEMPTTESISSTSENTEVSGAMAVSVSVSSLNVNPVVVPGTSLASSNPSG